MMVEGGKPCTFKKIFKKNTKIAYIQMFRQVYKQLKIIFL